jgi:hypothetical protein
MKITIMKSIYTGMVRNESWGDGWYIDGESVDLDMLLYEFKNRKVKITIEEINEGE